MPPEQTTAPAPSTDRKFRSACEEIAALFLENPLYEYGDDILQAQYATSIDQLHPEISYIAVRRSGQKYGVTAVLTEDLVFWQGIPKMGYRT